MAALRGRLRCMSDGQPKLDQLNLVVRDIDASLDFYRRLGIEPAGGTGGPHVEFELAGGLTLEMDTVEEAAIWHAGVRAEPASRRVVIGFRLASRADVDTRYAELTGAGYAGRQPPFDAFWGARYAIVADPDGNDVGLMSPVDESMRSWPPDYSPDL